MYSKSLRAHIADADPHIFTLVSTNLENRGVIRKVKGGFVNVPRISGEKEGVRGIRELRIDVGHGVKNHIHVIVHQTDHLVAGDLFARNDGFAAMGIQHGNPEFRLRSLLNDIKAQCLDNVLIPSEIDLSVSSCYGGADDKGPSTDCTVLATASPEDTKLTNSSASAPTYFS